MGLISLYSYLKVGCKQVRCELFSPATSDKMRRHSLKLHQDRFRFDLRKNFFCGEGHQALERSGQGGGEVTITKGVKKQLDMSISAMV